MCCRRERRSGSRFRRGSNITGHFSHRFRDDRKGGNAELLIRPQISATTSLLWLPAFHLARPPLPFLCCSFPCLASSDRQKTFSAKPLRNALTRAKPLQTVTQTGLARNLAAAFHRAIAAVAPFNPDNIFSKKYPGLSCISDDYLVLACASLSRRGGARSHPLQSDWRGAGGEVAARS